MASRGNPPSRGRARGATELMSHLKHVNPPAVQGAAEVEDEHNVTLALQDLSYALPKIEEKSIESGTQPFENEKEEVGMFPKAIHFELTPSGGGKPQQQGIPDTSRTDAGVEFKPAKNNKGSSGVDEQVITNYLVVNKSPNFVLNGYRVDFEPAELDDTRLKRQLMSIHKVTLGNFMFDGHTLYTGSTIPKDLETLESVNTLNRQKFVIRLRLVAQIRPGEKVYLQFHNIAFRSMLEKIGMEQIGRHFYDRKKAISMEEERLDLWPGITTSIRDHEAGMLLCVELTHKILRRETAFDMMHVILKNTLERSRNRNPKTVVNEVIKTELINCIVLTHYNRRTYNIDDIEFNKTPRSKFALDDGTSITYVDYYKKRWNIDLVGDEELNQPLLVSNPRKKDQNKGVTGPIYLVPSLCFMTGLTEAQRKNFQLTRKLGVHLHMPPADRKKKLDEFIKQFLRPEIKEEFAKWNFEFGTTFIPAPVRILPPEQIQMRTIPSGAVEWFPPDKGEDWTFHFKNAGLLTPVELRRWVIFTPTMEPDHTVREFVKTFQRAGKKLGCRIANPESLIRYDARIRFSMNDFMNSLRNQTKGLEMVFYILPPGFGTRYNDVKRACTLQLKVVSQCFQSKNLRSKSLVSICQKMVIQINAKLNGEPWAVRIPIANSMILGFDCFRCPSRKDSHVGALVGSVNRNCTRYFSTVSFHTDKSSLSVGLNAGILKCLDAYLEVNQTLPARIIIYRDGVGDGQIDHVLTEEVRQIQMGIRGFYQRHGKHDDVKLAVVVVTKKINTRYLMEERGTWTNPAPGTILDSVVTLPERYDYFLVSQTVRQGTVSPTSYNVVHDTSGISPDHLQLLTYKLCHLYFNWSGSVAVPAPCQYAHKLAQITGNALAEEAPISLSQKMWYL